MAGFTLYKNIDTSPLCLAEMRLLSWNIMKPLICTPQKTNIEIETGGSQELYAFFFQGSIFGFYISFRRCYLYYMMLTYIRFISIGWFVSWVGKVVTHWGKGKWYEEKQ